MSETAEEKERLVVAECMHHLPAKMDQGDGEVLLSILYKRGMLIKYLDAVTREGGYFNFRRRVELDSEGRITVLRINCYNNQSGCNNLPPIIERLHKLERIDLLGCKLLPIELGNLPLLKSISFHWRDRDLFENIPEGLVLSALKKVTIWNDRGVCPSLSAFWKMLPDTLEELLFHEATREQSDDILCALQNNDFGFRESLTKIKMWSCQLNEKDLERLLFDILPRFANLHTLNVGSNYNSIRSLRGIEDRIKKIDRISSSSSSSSPQTVIPVNKLRKLILRGNIVTWKVSNNADYKRTYDPKEVAALITILDSFDGIHHIGAESKPSHYPSDVEHLLRINHAGRRFIKEGEKAVPGSNKPVIKLALWPKILENAHSKSAEIYDNDFCDEETKNRKKCATGLFHLVRHFYVPLLAENHRRQSCDNRETSASALSIAAALSTTD